MDGETSESELSGPPGDPKEIDFLYAQLYDDLRSMARERLSKSEPITLLDTTSLVHESYLRFAKAGRLAALDRPRFLAYASHAMRSVIVDLVRRRHAERRGGDETRVEFDQAAAAYVRPGEETVLRVNEALNDLAGVDLRLVHVVEMRYFAGLEEQEIAASLGVTERTVRRDWRKARLLLSLALQ